MMKVGVLGAGYMGSVHARCYSRNANCSIAYVYDNRIEKAQALSGLYGCKATSKIDEVLGGGIDFVDICLPTFLHKEFACMAADAKKAVLLEKPMALSVEDSDCIIHTARQNGVRLMIAHVMRFWSEYVYAKGIVDDMELGQPVSASTTRMQSMPVWSDRNWIADPNLSHGGVVDLQIHDIDFLSWMFGPVSKLVSMGSRSEQNAWEHVFTVMEHASGVKCCLETSNLMPRGYPFTLKFRLVFANGCIEYDNTKEQSLIVYKGGNTIYTDIPRLDGYQAEIDYFVSCLIEDRDFNIITPQQARESLYLSLLSKESLDNGRECIIK